MTENKTTQKSSTFKRQKTFNVALEEEEQFYNNNPEGIEIKGLWNQSLQPVNFNIRGFTYKDGKLVIVREDEIPHDFTKLLQIYPSSFEKASFEGEGKKRFANIYFNRITDKPKKSEKFYIRILDVVMKSDGFFEQKDIKYNKKPCYKMLINVLKAGKLLANLTQLEYHVEQTVSGGDLAPVKCNKYIKENGGDDDTEKMLFFDLYVDWSKFNKTIPVVVDGKEGMMDVESFNQHCVRPTYSYDMVFSVNPWIRYVEGDEHISVGFSYSVEHIDVRRKLPNGEKVGTDFGY